ncbi:MAG: sigma 54-interacting transcriptional regulator [Holophagales bacterium]|nr:sigma 54-interacting transcriptional regulator [Holophagales bacterium]
MEPTKSSWLEKDTVSATRSDLRSWPEVRIPGLTLLACADPRRIGERAILNTLDTGRVVELSRLSPELGDPGLGGGWRPLADPHLSRTPIRLSATRDGGIRIDAGASPIRLQVDGIAVTGERRVSTEELEYGVVLTLANRAALLLHLLTPAPSRAPERFGLVGESQAMIAVRQQISSIADLEVPALVRGETGTGKELVATGLHRASKRRSGPLVAVNMGALPPSLAAAELFGVTKGAFTGADRRRDGLFTRAHQGTLFLDEIGETSAEIQGMLLRTLETGEIQPVGSETTRTVSVRVVAATDAPLEHAIASGRFRAPLLHRLAGYEIRLPPLRRRRDDIGRLLVHFLRQELETLGEAWRVERPGDRCWLPPRLVTRLALYPWPGNVRQLRNVARQLVIANRGADRLAATPEIEALLSEARDSAPAERDVAPRRSSPAGISQPPTSQPPTSQPPAYRPPPSELPEQVAPPHPEDRSLPGARSVLRALLAAELSDPAPVARQLGRRGALTTRSRHDRAARRLLAEHEGFEVEKRHGFLLSFELPADAVAFALAYQTVLRELSEDVGVAVAARVGIYFGEMRLRHNHPEAVARGAARLEIEPEAKMPAEHLASLALDGQVLLSRSAYDLARQAIPQDGPLADPELCWLDHGSFPIAGEVAKVEVFEVGYRGRAPLTAPRLPEDPSTGIANSQAAQGAPPRPTYRAPDSVGEEELLSALRAHAFRLQPTATALGMARTSLYALIEKSPHIRKAKDLGREEIERCGEQCGGDLDRMAATLEVSRKGLRRRMTALGMD